MQQELSKHFDATVFILRASPFHLGHKAVIDQALKQSDKVILLLGSANSGRTYRNPFTYHERVRMIAETYNDDLNRIVFKPLDDYTYNNTVWVNTVQKLVHDEVYGRNTNDKESKFVVVEDSDTGRKTYTLEIDDKNIEDASVILNNIKNEIINAKVKKIGLIGHSKDASSFYLNLFPSFGSIDVENYMGLNATDIRKNYFSNEQFDKNDTVPENVYNFLMEFKNTKEYKEILDEYTFVQKYKDSWKSAPFPPVHVTVDSVVVQSNHVLLIERKGFPGKGKWALPGGFLNQDEELLDASIRELKEETLLNIPEKILRSSLVKDEVFADPHRSSRGRTVTHAFFYKLNDQKDLPRVYGSDDASKAFFVPLCELRAEFMYEDHFHIIRKLTESI